MTAQLCLLVDPVPPARPVATSIAAATEARVFAGEQRERVYAFIKGKGRCGATRKDVERALGIPTQSACPRMWELHGGKRVNGVPQYRVRITGTGGRRERCEIYVAL